MVWREQLSLSYSGAPAGVLSRESVGEVRTKAEACPKTVVGIVVQKGYSDGKVGATVNVCADQTCKKHWGAQGASGRQPSTEAQKKQRRKELLDVKAVCST